MTTFRQVLSAKAIFPVSAIQIPEFRLDTIRKIQERCGFLKVPTTYDEMFGNDPAEGIQFYHGRFVRGDRSIPIELLQLLPGMIVVETRTSTDDAEAFVDDYIQNANKNYPNTIVITGPTLYVSAIEFTMDKSLDRLIPGAKTTNAAIDNLLSKYGSKIPSFGVMGAIFNFDTVGMAGVVPAHFTIERRKDFPFSANTYFSQAPLKTNDHKDILENLDRTLGI